MFSSSLVSLPQQQFLPHKKKKIIIASFPFGFPLFCPAADSASLMVSEEQTPPPGWTVRWVRSDCRSDCFFFQLNFRHTEDGRRVRKRHHSVSEVTEVTMAHRLVCRDPLLPLKLKFRLKLYQQSLISNLSTQSSSLVNDLKI